MAKRFQFRLETIRRLRKQRQDECRRVVAARLRQVAGVEEQIEAFADQFDLHVAALRRLALPESRRTSAAGESPGPTSIDIGGVRRHRAYTNHLRGAIVAARRQLAAQRVELAKERAVLAEATKAVKVLDKLEERQRRGHELAAARAETVLNDEIAAQFARRSAVAAVATVDDRP